ncbi:MAG TPA: virulence factor SrfC family protein, partial [Isosphaeraceae bacterium]
GDWLGAHAPARRGATVGEIAGEEQSELLRLRQATRDLARSARVPVAAAVYGPSQVGKSLFVGRVLRPADPSYSPLGRDEHLGPPGYYPDLDFIADLNPQLGEREATALVTRFTTKDRIDPEIPTHVPVGVKALARAEWLQLLARGFKAECRRRDGAAAWDLARLRAAFDEVARDSGAAEADPAWRTDLYDAYTYMRRHAPREFAATDVEFNGLLGAYRLSEPGYLVVAARLFWDDWPELTELFREVAAFLAQIHATGKGGLLTHWAGVRFLLDSQLARAHENPASRCFQSVAWADFVLERDRKSGWYVLDYRPGVAAGAGAVPAYRLQAALLELVIPVLPERLTDEWRRVLGEMDLLDIPGMRAERALEQGKRTGARRLEERMEIVKRGKVLYLFERYIEEMQVQTLLLLTRHGNLEVKDQIQHHVDLWGRARYGAAWPRGVADEPPPLFIGMTGIDAEFRHQAAAPSPLLYEHRIATLVDILGPAVMDHLGGRRFTNIFPIRYPGTWDTTAENRRAREDPARWDLAARAFLASDLVAQYVHEPERRWHAALDDRDGGLSLIAAGFRASTSVVGKQDHLKQRIEQAEARLLHLAGGWAIAEDANLDRDRRLALAGRVLDWLGGDEDLVYDRVLALKRALCVQEADIWGLADSPRVAQAPPGRRFPDHLRGFLTSWATTSAPRRWDEATAARDAGRPWLPAEEFQALARYLVDYLGSPGVFEALLARLQ